MRVLLIGLGAIGQTHTRALEATPQAEVVAGVDVEGAKELTFRGLDRPVYRSLREASEAQALPPDIVVIATPTGSSTSACSRKAARRCPQPPACTCTNCC